MPIEHECVTIEFCTGMSESSANFMQYSDMNNRQLKKEIFELLSAPDIQERLESFEAFPARQAVNPLFSFLYHTEPIIKWHAVSAMGHVVAGLANTKIWNRPGHHAPHDMEPE
jgi:hypothetical protein